MALKCWCGHDAQVHVPGTPRGSCTTCTGTCHGYEPAADREETP